MPLRNRVDPWGELHAVPDRGALMGNRGVLHDADRNIVRPFKLTRWLMCVLRFRGQRRALMQPNRYTELFFLDEATGFAAGHRPCAECQPKRWREFRDAWRAANPQHAGGAGFKPADLDAVLHAERWANSARRLHAVEGALVPDGAMVALVGAPHLVVNGVLRPWGFGGYGPPAAMPTSVEMLTPPSVAAVFRAGFVPRGCNSTHGQSV